MFYKPEQNVSYSNFWSNLKTTPFGQLYKKNSADNVPPAKPARRLSAKVLVSVSVTKVFRVSVKCESRVQCVRVQFLRVLCVSVQCVRVQCVKL